jgi:hypothetical protein
MSMTGAILLSKRLALPIWAGLLLAGCLPDQREAAARCELRIKMAPASQTLTQMANNMHLCMEGEGYEFTEWLVECANSLIDTHYLCYQPTRWLPRLTHRIEASFVTADPARAW